MTLSRPGSYILSSIPSNSSRHMFLRLLFEIYIIRTILLAANALHFLLLHAKCLQSRTIRTSQQSVRDRKLKPNYRLSGKLRQKGNGADKSGEAKQREKKQQRQTCAFFQSTATSCWSQSANLAQLLPAIDKLCVCVCVCV